MKIQLFKILIVSGIIVSTMSLIGQSMRRGGNPSSSAPIKHGRIKPKSSANPNAGSNDSSGVSGSRGSSGYNKYTGPNRYGTPNYMNIPR